MRSQDAPVGATLRILRIDAGLSLRALAREIGVSSAYLSRVENGHDPAPTPERLAAIADALELPPPLLLELANRTGSVVSEYLEEVPAAHALFLEVARRGLDATQLAQLRDFMDTQFGPSASNSAAEVSLASVLEDRLVVGAPCTSVDEVIVEGVRRLSSDPGIASTIERRIREREATSPTFLGAGVCVPHAIVPEVGRTVAALVTLKTPLSRETPDGAPISVAIVLASAGPGPEHLEVLARIARLASHDLAQQLREVDSPARVRALIRAIEGCSPPAAERRH